MTPLKNFSIVPSVTIRRTMEVRNKMRALAKEMRACLEHAPNPYAYKIMNDIVEYYLPNDVMRAKDMVKNLEEKFGMVHTPEAEALEDHKKGLCLAFNEGGDLISEWEENEETYEDIEAIMEFITRNGWELIENPVDVQCYLIAPTGLVLTEEEIIYPPL